MENGLRLECLSALIVIYRPLRRHLALYLDLVFGNRGPKPRISQRAYTQAQGQRGLRAADGEGVKERKIWEVPAPLGPALAFGPDGFQLASVNE